MGSYMYILVFFVKLSFLYKITLSVNVVDPGEGVCADPVNRGAILGRGGPDLKGGNEERQLSPDKERDKT
jgi:hypothetical protein